MSTLVDTNVLLRLVEPNHPMHINVLDALDNLRRGGETLCIVPQNLIEFWAVATRPRASNGLEMSFDEAMNELTSLKYLFVLLPGESTLFAEWERLISLHRTMGKQVHDARIVAAMNAHGIKHLLTFNLVDFKRYADIVAIDPRRVTAP